MKALVPAGGPGTRLRTLTPTSAKQPVPAANKPVLFHGPEAIAGAGVTEVGIAAGDTAAEIRAAVGGGSASGVDVTCVPQAAIGRVRAEAGARVTGSRIPGPAVVGAGTVVTGSRVGPFTSIAGDCRIEDSGIEHSVVLRGSSPRGAGRLEASLVGRDAEFTPATREPAAHRPVLGDHGEVRISS